MRGRSITPGSWYKGVGLGSLETGLVTVGAPVHDLPPIVGISRPDSVETIVLAKSSLDGRAARVGSDAKGPDTDGQRMCGRRRVSRSLHSNTPLAGDLRRPCRVYTPSLR